MAVLAVGSPALAQDAAGPVLAQEVETSPKEMVQGAKDALSEMNFVEQTVNKDLEAATKSNDTTAAGCVRDRLNAIRALSMVSDRAQQDMLSALDVGEVARADHEYRKIQVALAKVREFLSEAQSCLGGEIVADNGTQVTVEGLAAGQDDTSGLGLSDGEVGVDPPSTTGFE